MSLNVLLILLATLAAGVGSVLIAAWLTFGVLARYTQHLLSLAAGALLATAFMHLLPEAMQSSADAHDLFAVLLGCLVFFFLLDKAQLYHHGHEHSHEHAHEHPHSHSHGHDHFHGDASQAQETPVHKNSSGGWSVLVGDSVHCFGDGVLIASAFMADVKLGWVRLFTGAAQAVFCWRGHGAGRFGGLFAGGAVGQFAALHADRRLSQLRLCGAGRFDPAVADAAEFP
jgi:zinc and cadmium transporter